MKEITCRTLIADDEQPARDRLQKLLAEYPAKIEVIGEAKEWFGVSRNDRQVET